MEVDWRKRLETRENQIYHQHEELIRNLKTSKDEVRVFVIIFYGF